MFKSIRTRLIFAFSVMATLPIVVVGLILSYKSVTALKDEAISYQRAESERIGIAVEDYIQELERVLELTSKAHRFISLSKNRKKEILEELLAYENRFEQLTLIESSGKEIIRCNRIAVVLENALENHSDDPLFKQALILKANIFSPIQFDSKTGEPYMVIAVPLLSYMTGNIEYVLLGSIRLKKLWNILSNLSHKGETVLIVDEKGDIIGHPDPSVVLSGNKFMVPKNQQGIATDLDGNSIIFAKKTTHI